MISCFGRFDPSEVVLGQFNSCTGCAGSSGEVGRDTFVAARLWINDPRCATYRLPAPPASGWPEEPGGVSLILAAEPGLGSAQPAPETNMLLLPRGDGEIDLSLMAKSQAELDLDHARASIPLSSLASADPLPPDVR